MRNVSDDLNQGGACSAPHHDERERIEVCLQRADLLLLKDPSLRKRDVVCILRGYAGLLQYYARGAFPWWKVEAILVELGDGREYAGKLTAPAPEPQPVAIAPAPPPPRPPAPKPKPKPVARRRRYLRRYEGRWVTAHWIKTVLARQ